MIRPGNLSLRRLAYVVKERRGHAASLEAARLQGVSLQLARKPELTGLHRENAEKVLAMIARRDALKSTPAGQQLRQAVQVLARLLIAAISSVC
jgi:hypothetical protein